MTRRKQLRKARQIADELDRRRRTKQVVNDAVNYVRSHPELQAVTAETTRRFWDKVK